MDMFSLPGFGRAPTPTEQDFLARLAVSAIWTPGGELARLFHWAGEAWCREAGVEVEYWTAALDGERSLRAEQTARGRAARSR